MIGLLGGLFPLSAGCPGGLLVLVGDSVLYNFYAIDEGRA